MQETSLPQKLTWKKDVPSVLEEMGLGQAFVGSDLAFLAFFSSSDFMVFSVSWSHC